MSASGRRSSPAVKVAVAAVAVSVAVMILSIAIVFGFKENIRDRITGFNSHISVYSQPDEEGDNIVVMDQSLQKFLDSCPYITSYSLELSMPAILKTKTDFKGIYLKGMGRGADTRFLRQSVVQGSIPDFGDPSSADKIVISQIMADRLGLKTGDSIDTYFIIEDLLVRRLKIAAVYNSHFEQYDDVLAYSSLPMLQDLAGIKHNEATAVRIMTDNFDLVDPNTESLQNTLVKAYAEGKIAKPYLAENARTQGFNYFQWLGLLDTNVIVVLILMLAVAAITLVSGMLILIIDKTRFIGIVRALGMSNRSLSRVFIFLSIRVALIGLIIGNVAAIVLVCLQYYFHIIPLDAEAYYFDFVPVSLQWGAFLLLDVATVAVIFLTLLLPSRYVSKISPARSMRYE